MSMLYCDRHGYYHPGTNRVGTNAAGAGVVMAWDVCPTCEGESARAMLGCLGWLAAGAVAFVVVLFGLVAAVALLSSASTPAEVPAEVGDGSGLAGSSIVDRWDATASVHRGRNGESFTFECPGAGEIQRVFGAGPYTDDSSVCSAGVHAGAITAADGGLVVIEILPGQAAYEGIDANGVDSSSWGEWPGSFSVQVP